MVVPTGKKLPEETILPFATDVTGNSQELVTLKFTLAPHCVLPGAVLTTMLSGHVMVHWPYEAMSIIIKQKLKNSGRRGVFLMIPVCSLSLKIDKNQY